MALEFPVSSGKLAALDADFAKLGLKEEDLEESFIRSSGPGGQNVNKVATCVVLVHKPTGTTVRMQSERSQAVNRFLARRLLADRLKEKLTGEASERQQEVWKIRKQKRKRSRRAKQKMLEEKRQHGEKKELRRKVEW